MEERRKYTQSKESWFITIETPEGSISGETENISSDGAFIRCEKPLAPNEIFDMVITLPDSGTTLKGRAEVVWSTERGMGVTFQPEDDST
jgi:PilZ domain